ncbi:PREDICTED: plant UBX domain-containing protein 3 [Nelumbo nucifera]|uniref:Plant UBX domain-containing protein 3 n=1 Tax=Nelumbo nucifera TaxID=4432 RepID=A0A1U8Q283_NELNU|nr:PREDICTED: plant UBX domain-containing protein 3 [Nelumbo nucifera]
MTTLMPHRNTIPAVKEVVCSSKILLQVMMWMQYLIKLGKWEPWRDLLKTSIHLQAQEASLELGDYSMSIRKSECPKEFEPEDRRSPVQVNLKRRGEKCPEPEKCHIPFQGVGRTLGGSSSSTTAPEPTVTASAPSPI